MKTVMQEFADNLKQMAIAKEKEGSYCAGLWNTIHHWATQMVDKEKEQIVEAYLKGYLEEIPNPSTSNYYNDMAEQYYNATFKSE